jgi:hypothetical protein
MARELYVNVRRGLIQTGPSPKRKEEEEEEEKEAFGKCLCGPKGLDSAAFNFPLLFKHITFFIC